MKSNTMLVIFAAIIFIAGILYLIAFLMKRKNDDKLDILEERKIALFDLPVIEEVDEVKKMHLVGQSQNTFREWNQKWTTISTTAFAELESRIFEAENLNESFRFIKVKKAIQEAYDTMDEMEQEVESIRAGLKELRESEANNSLAVQEALDAYEEMNHTVHNEGEQFGPALKELEKQVNNIETEFTQFVALNTSGDPMEAREVLEEAERKTYEIKDIMTRIPECYIKLSQEFPEQINEIEEGYQEMKDAHYLFPGNFVEENIKKVNKLLKETLSDLEKCEIDIVENNIGALSELIEQLYESMEVEVEARQYVVKNQSALNEYIQHTFRNNRQLMIELDHVSQSYTLNRNELGRSRAFQTQIEEIQKRNLEVENTLKEKDAIYSDIEKFYRDTFQFLKDIETEQLEIDKGVQQLRKDERTALKKVDEFELKLRSMKRYIEKHRLPGIPADYLEFFFVSTGRIEELSKELNKIRIDIDEINHLVELCEDDINLLSEKTTELIDNAALSEQMLQYANRYRHTHADVRAAIDVSLKLFNEEYRYQDALSAIRSALEKAEPGAPKRLETFYYKHKEEM